jgi:hypothetical protein
VSFRQACVNRDLPSTMMQGRGSVTPQENLSHPKNILRDTTTQFVYNVPHGIIIINEQTLQRPVF